MNQYINENRESLLDKKIIIFTSSNHNNYSSYLSLDIGHFLSLMNKKVLLLDFSNEQEIQNFITNKQSISIKNCLQSINNCNMEKLFTNSKIDNSNLHILCNEDFITNFNIQNKNLEKLLSYFDYLLLNTGFFSSSFIEQFKKYNTILTSGNSVKDLNILQKIFKTNFISPKSINSIITFEKDSQHIKQICEALKISLNIYKYINKQNNYSLQNTLLKHIKQYNYADKNNTDKNINIEKLSKNTIENNKYKIIFQNKRNLKLYKSYAQITIL